MIFKFDKSGNMEDIGMEGDNDMGRKSNKDKFQQVDVSLVNQVKEEVLGMGNETQSQVAVGFESLNDDEEDMVQQHEMELVKEMESENDRIWDKGSRNGVVGDEDDDVKERPPFGSLSSMNEQVKMEDNGDNQIPKDEFNEEYTDAQRKKDELAKKRELRKLKQELKQNDLKLKESTSWSFSPVIPVYNQGEIIKYICTISSFDLASYFENFIIRFIPSIQRGSVTTSSGKEKDNFSNKHVNDIFQAFTKKKIFGNTIVLNYSSSNESELVYNPEDNSISGEGYLLVWIFDP